MRIRAVIGASAMVVGLLLAAAPFPVQAEDATAATQAGETAPSEQADALAVLDQVLNFDESTLALSAPAWTLPVPKFLDPSGLNVSRANQPNGSSIVTVKRPLGAAWDAHVGVDLGLAGPMPVSYQPSLLIPGRASDPSNAVWASMGLVPNLATLNARVDTGSDQGRIGTTFQHSLPVGNQFSLTLHDSTAFTGSFGVPNSTATGPGLPIIAMPAAASTESVWSNEGGVKFNILQTGTTLSAGLAALSNDPVTHNSLSADQRLYGPLHVTTSVTDLGEEYSNKSITAGFKLNW